MKDVILEDAKGKKEIYQVTTDDGLVGTARSRSFLDLIGKDVYLEIKTKSTKKGTTVEFFRVDVSEWKKDKDALDRLLDESGLHPGQFFYQEFLKDPLNRVRERIVLRDRFKKEFDAIWQRQAQAHPILTDPATRDKVVRAVIPNNKVEQAKWLTKDLGTFVRDHVIYYQRPLRSQVASKGKCRFEPRKPVMPVSSPIYQSFRIWQQVNNIRLLDRYMKEEELTVAETEKVIAHLLNHNELKRDNLLKVIGRAKEERENNLRADLPGHQTLAKLRTILKNETIWPQLVQEAGQLKDAEGTTLFRIWHILYSIQEEADRKRALGFLELPEETLARLARVRFERKHGAVSARAAGRITKLMAKGSAYSWENIHQRDQQRIQALIDTGEVEGMNPELRSKLADLTSLDQFQGLPYWKAAAVLYGDHRAKLGEPFAEPEEVKAMPRGFLRNPVVEQVVNETLMLMRDIWKQYGRPTSIRVELARELRQNIDERKKTHDNNRRRDQERKKVVEELVTKHNRSKPSRKDIEKFELWVEQKHCCMYSGKPIQAADLFNTRAVDIDHIIPQALYYDDSRNNKVLVYRSENAGHEGKNKELAASFIKSKGPAAWESYVQRVKELGFSRGKKKYLLAEEVPESFINRQLQETRYIGTEVRKHLQRFAPVNTTLGTVTDALKNEWGLNKVYKEVLLPRFERLENIVQRKLIEEIPGRNGHKDWKIEGFEKRIDHRHHALDALVVALTRQGFIQRLSNMNQLKLTDEEKAAMKRPTWYPLPHPELRRLVKEQLERTIPSIKNRQRILTKASNFTQKLVDAETGAKKLVPQKKGVTYAVRGPLHDEQPMGEIREQRRWPLKKVLDWLGDQPDPVAALQLVKAGEAGYKDRFIAHEHERKLLADHLQKYGGNVASMKKALKKDPIVTAKNEPVEQITVLETKFAVVRTLGPMFSMAMVEKIIDRQAQARIRKHLELFGNDPKKAFASDALFQLKEQKLKKVRCIAFDTLIKDSKGFTPLPAKQDPNKRKHVKKGENHALIVYVNENTGERDFDVISFYDAVARKLKGIPLADQRPGWRSFSLRKNDLVYVPRPGENVATINWEDREMVGDRIMRMTQMSGKQYYFLRANVAQTVDFSKNEQEYGSQSASEFEDRDSPRTKIAMCCVPVIIDRLGQPRPVHF